jgi:diaminopimelate decarboxylase/aspartate kinase
MGQYQVSEKWLVLKFGGSSVRGLDQWQAIAERIRERRAQGYRLVLVCSAVEGMTDLLHDLTRRPGDQPLIDRFLRVHENLAKELDIDGRQWINKARERLSRLAGESGSTLSLPVIAEVLATGEWLCTRLGWAFLQQEFETEWVDARGLLEVKPHDKHSERRRWLSAECECGPSSSLRAGLEGCWPVVVTQGYIAGMPGGGAALLGRGGSDTSAALLGGRIGAERIEIWTDVPGLFSADPRVIPEARLLRQLEYAEALEMAASGASVVQPRAVRAAAATNTPVWIADTARPDIGGTHINCQANTAEGARAVMCQQGMAVLLLQNIDPRQQVGFLAWVFGVVASHGVSIDLVATSETTTTVAINREANHMDANDLAALADDLRARCKVD